MSRAEVGFSDSKGVELCFRHAIQKLQENPNENITAFAVDNADSDSSWCDSFLCKQCTIE